MGPGILSQRIVNKLLTILEKSQFVNRLLTNYQKILSFVFLGGIMYGEDFSRVQKHFLEAANLAKNNERNVKGIVINPFTEAFVVPEEMFEVIARMESSVEDSAGVEVQ